MVVSTGNKQPYPAVHRGVFQPSTSQEDLETIQQWLGEQHTLFLSLGRIHQEAAQEILRQQQRRAVSAWDSRGGAGAGIDLDAADDYAGSLEEQGPPASHLPYYTRLFDLVVQSNRDLVSRLAELRDDAVVTDADMGSPSSSSSAVASSSSRYVTHVSRTLIPILTLAQTLYLSPNATDLQHGGQGIIGEELLHWLNSYDLAPTTEEGREIASNPEPHLHPAYWDYILRCTLRGFHSTVSTLLSTLLTLPSRSLQQLISRVRDLVQTLPRSTAFKTEVQFKSARREFGLRLTGVLAGLENIMDDVQDELVQDSDDSEEPSEEAQEEAEDLRLSLEAGLRVFLEVLAGNKERVVEAAEDWKEALTAWGTLVDVGLKRDGLSDALAKVRSLRSEGNDLAEEAESVEEQVMIKLIKGNTREACDQAASIDPYLAQVLSNFLTKLALVSRSSAGSQEDEDEMGASASKRVTSSPSQPSLLEKSDLVYANTLLSSFGLWRMALDYLAEAGVRGRARMSQVLLGVPLLQDPSEVSRTAGQNKASREGDDSGADDEDDEEDQDLREFHRVESILEACQAFGLEREARAVSRKLSMHLSSSSRTTHEHADGAAVSSARYGPAIVYALRSPPRGDATALSKIKTRVLKNLLTRKRGERTPTSTAGGGVSEAEAWFVREVRDIKRWIMRSQRLEEERMQQQNEAGGLDGAASEITAATAGPFLTRRAKARRANMAGMSANARRRAREDQLREDEALLDDEEEWNTVYGYSLPAPVLLLTSLARFFQLKAAASTTPAAAAAAAQDSVPPAGSPSPYTFLIELLNAGLVDGDWVSICLYEIGQMLPSPLSSDTLATDPQSSVASPDDPMLYDVLRVLESLLFNATLSSSEEEYSLGKLGLWLGVRAKAGESGTGRRGSGDGHTKSLTDDGSEEDLHMDSLTRDLAVSRARKEMQRLRLRVGLALAIPAVPSSQQPSIMAVDARIRGTAAAAAAAAAAAGRGTSTATRGATAAGVEGEAMADVDFDGVEEQGEHSGDVKYDDWEGEGEEVVAHDVDGDDGDEEGAPFDEEGGVGEDTLIV